MARPLRLQVAGGIYHVVARGDRGDPIYRDDADRRIFLRVAARVASRLEWRFLAYCLMRNHYHLVVQTPRPNLARGMQQLNGTYAQRFNQRHDRTRAHLFQGRYHGALVQRDSHLLEVIRYVAWNPVRAGLCDQPASWRWSSHRAALGLEPPGLVSVDALLSYFGDAAEVSRRVYSAFVDRKEPEQSPTENAVIVGSDGFLRASLPQERPSREIPKAPWRAVRPRLQQLLAEHDRDEAFARAYRDFDYTMREIAEAADCHYSTVSRRVHRWESGCMNARPDPL
jgi:putative transposase